MSRLLSGWRRAARGLLEAAAVRRVLYLPAVKRLLDHTPFARMLYQVWDRGHPFDREYGVDTLGIVSVDRITSDRQLASQIVCYAGSQPSIVRTALSALGPLEDYTLLDFGCGKGRAAIVASEFPFRQVIGVELSPELAAVARANAAIVAQRFPARPGIDIVEGNVLDVALPAGKLAVFAYHPFGERILTGVARRLEAAIDQGAGHIFFVYDNAVHAAVLDSSPMFKRFYAETVPYHHRELGYGLFEHDAVVIWQSVRGAIPTPYGRVDRAVRVVGGRAQLDPR